jgi:hypothetical protein
MLVNIEELTICSLDVKKTKTRQRDADPYFKKSLCLKHDFRTVSGQFYF